MEAEFFELELVLNAVAPFSVVDSTVGEVDDFSRRFIQRSSPSPHHSVPFYLVNKHRVLKVVRAQYPGIDTILAQLGHDFPLERGRSSSAIENWLQRAREQVGFGGKIRLTPVR